MRKNLALLGLVLVLAAAVLTAGCYFHGRYHTSARVGAHVHFDGCGHHHWHGGWYEYPHPHDCHSCGGGVGFAVHVHDAGCGHHHWHDGWYDYPHPYDCYSCAPPPVVSVHVHGGGCGHYYWHTFWWDAPHPFDCHCSGGGGSVHVHFAGCGHSGWGGGGHGHGHGGGWSGGGGGGGHHDQPRTIHEAAKEQRKADRQQPNKAYRKWEKKVDRLHNKVK